MNPLKAFLSRYFYLCMSLILAALVILGFSRTVNASLFHANPPRPLLLWIHGAAFSTWVVFFIAQSALVRARRVSVHRLLGWFGASLAAVMVVLGLTVAVVMTRFDISVLHHCAEFCPLYVAGQSRMVGRNHSRGRKRHSVLRVISTKIPVCPSSAHDLFAPRQPFELFL